MNNVHLPEDCAKQWEILLLLLSSEEKKIDRTSDSEIDTMNYFYKNEGVRKILTHWLQQMQKTYAKKLSDSNTALKCNEISQLWRQRGNDNFRANRVKESYRCYCVSVLYAPQDGPMYPLALANRSAALLRMKRFQECLADIKLALDHGYSNEQRHKLLLRQADCHIELGSREQAVAALSAAATHAHSLQLAPTHAAEFDRHIKILERKLEALQEINEVKQEEVPIPECYKGENPNFFAASNALELRRSESCGRFVVACEPTRRGDVLFSEEPYAWVTLPEGDPDRGACETCCQADVNPVPCGTCSRSVYCGEECRARGSRLFHRWECSGAQAAIFPTIGIAHLALRVLLITASEGFPRVPNPTDQPSSAAELFQAYSRIDDIQIYKKDTPAFYRMFNLVTNFDKMNNTDYIQYALTATMLTLYLERWTTFFDELPSRLPHALPARQLRVFAAALLLRALGQLVCNGHAALTLAVFVDDDTGEDGQAATVSEREVRRATAIYPSAAMMNHSCDPNIINTFYKGRLVVVSARELAAGGEALNCYGPHRAREPFAQRRAALRAQYCFTCACAVCADADRRDFVHLFSAYACHACKGPVTCNSGGSPKCPQCGAEFRVERALDALERARELLAEAKRARAPAERCEKAQAALKLQQHAWHRHHSALRDSADKVARLYADYGDFSKSVELIKQNIQSLEYQFGSFSAEVAHELRKLSDVMLERIVTTQNSAEYRDWCLETHKILKKAVQLTELNYGSWEPLVKRLKENEEFVASLLNESRSADVADSIHHNLHYNLKI
ncbi:SET and MYND domain-containing protein 4-like isoform X1 [Ostrinia furnacalis]|uniref:SET and MYND domain-containing protein 4-like isoform X1 n=1 Tax=Ostrinia furnacalis TaxID=93504 RepID=UPI001038BBDF|nr:SET and MYND domain-containing protein 4-like isoform X1 [Ostrinia furnacalis]